MSSRTHEIEFPIGLLRGPGPDWRPPTSYDELAAELCAALARERVLLQSQTDQLQRQGMLVREFEHRLINGLQLITSLLSLQSRTAPTPEASAQLSVAARRVAALGRVHRQLHQLDHQDQVEFKRYLENLCGDLSGLLLQEQPGHAIVVEGVEVEIPTAFAIPLGFIVNELITNSAKYGDGHIMVRLDAALPDRHLLSVSDDGPGLPVGFDPARSKGLGMKIIQSLVKQIGGELRISSGENGRGAYFTVSFVAVPVAPTQRR